MTKPDALREGSVLRLRSPVLATFLSFSGIGLGQFYNGDLVKGLAFIVLFLVPSFLPVTQQPGTFSFVWVMAGVWAVSLIDSPLSAWRINHLAKEFSGASPLFWIEVLILVGSAGWYFFTGNAWSLVNIICPPARFFA